MSDKILSETSGVIARIIFNQPEKRNAVSLAMWETVEGLLDRYRDDDSIRVLILSGAGGLAFVSGADISEFEDLRSSRDAVAYYDEVVVRVFSKIEDFPKPVIAQIDGFCIGGGLGLAVSCDIRICGQSAQFAIPAAKLGLGYGLEGIDRLIGLVGPAFAKEIFFTARRFSAEEAAAMGLVNRVVDDGDVARAAADMAETIAANAPLTVQSVKFIAGQAMRDDTNQDTEACAASVRACFESNDYAEGRRAFMEKRPPVFTGT